MLFCHCLLIQIMTEQEQPLFFKIIEEEKSKFNHKALEYIMFAKLVLPEKAISRVSRMNAIINKSLYEAVWHNTMPETLQTQQIKTIENDTNLGFFAGCYLQISLEHLKIKPEIRLCTDCLKGN